MTPNLKYQGTVKPDGLHIINRKRFDADLLEFFHPKENKGKTVFQQVEIIVRKKRRSRSLEQNAYYWGVVIPMVKEGLNDLGWQYDAEDTHEYLKEQYLRVEELNEKTGELRIRTGSTKKITTTRFMEYIADIQQFASEELQTYIPDPNEQIKFEFLKTQLD